MMQFEDQIWRVTTETDELIVLPPKFAEEVRAHERVFDRNPSIERVSLICPKLLLGSE
jgi:hypothetical protein